MLIRFEVSNFRSIADAVELSMVAVDGDREEARATPQLGESLLTVAALFGPNASGKSNVLAALAWLRDAVSNSLKFWDDGIPIEPFAFGNGSTGSTEFVFETTVDGVRFEYVVELSREKVLYEGLFHYPEKKRRRIYEREGNELKLQRGLGTLSGTRELLTDQTLVLSIARRFGEPLITGFTSGLLGMRVFGLPPHLGQPSMADIGASGRSAPGLYATMQWFDEGRVDNEDEDRRQALALLRLADLGIDDVLIEREEEPFPGSDETRSRRRLRLLHKAGERSVPLDFAAESEGTKTWFRLIGPVLTALRHGTIVVFDELDASLHPTLSAELIRVFHNPRLNPRGAQIVFTTHDTSLLNHLNRDEVWLTEKRQDGSTRLGALAEFAGERVRRSQNLENAYLHGRFGALPQVDETVLLRALGLIG